MTLALFGPRWVWALPLMVLVPMTTVLSRRHLWVLLNASIVIVGPIMGFCVPWGRVLANDTGVETVRVLTCNAAGVRGGDLMALIEEVRPDLVVLQESGRMPDHPDFWRGWQLEGRWGVCL